MATATGIQLTLTDGEANALAKMLREAGAADELIGSDDLVSIFYALYGIGVREAQRVCENCLYPASHDGRCCGGQIMNQEEQCGAWVAAKEEG